MLPEALAGATLAALAVPEVLGYARIAGMPVVTGLYTMLAPMVVFAVLCSSRHLVVAADSATAALLLAGLTGLAAAGSPRYVALAGTVALVVAVLLVLARVVGVGFLANFLSRTVLVGFLTGVGITVAIGQLGDLLGVDPGSGDAPERLVQVLSELPHAHLPTVLVGGAVILVVLAGRLVDRRVPVALVAVVAAIAAEAVLGLSAFGVAVLGPVPSGVPGLVLPALAPADLVAAFPVAVSMAVVILAQSAATSRAYAARFDEQVDTDADLLALGGANLARRRHGHVRGQRQPDEDADGGRRGRAQPGRAARRGRRGRRRVRGGHRPAGRAAAGRAGRRRVPHRRRTRRRGRDAADPGRAAARVRRRGAHRAGRGGARRRGGDRRRRRGVDHRSPAAQLRPPQQRAGQVARGPLAFAAGGARHPHRRGPARLPVRQRAVLRQRRPGSSPTS